MPTELGPPFDITWRGDPQQMLPADVPLWQKFLDHFASWFDRFYYNVRVGGPDVSTIQGDPQIKRMWYLNTAKRIDAIGERRSDAWIIEVASSPYLRAVGQMLSYKFLWDKDPKINKPIHSVLLCPYIDSDLEAVLRHYGVYICKIYENQNPQFYPIPGL